MDKRTEIISILKEQGILPLYFHPDPAISIGVMKALYEAGIRAVEYTNRGKEALANFSVLRSLCDMELPGMQLGVGTIKEASAARDFVQAGADFLVSPGLAEDVFDISYSEKILWIPGCMTVTEIMKAEQFGLGLIKLFPGTLLGPDFVRAIREVFPNLLFIPTGGVELEKENLRNWFNAGVCAVGVGSKLITKELVQNKEYKKITDSALSLMNTIKALRSR
jgi:2-dehydro-3-deoxyphosphogluconate aldolase / (4S)-4-hydroxy-2-oxoglutarate aldolase